MKIIFNKKALMWKQVALWVIILGFLLVFLFLQSSLREKMIGDMKALFSFLRFG